jgi:hypothetical protein
MKCNYDDWDTPVVKSITPKMRSALKVMVDEKPRTRADMLWAAGIDPNPLTETGYVGNERTDFYLYRKGLIEIVAMKGQQKVFKITQTGLAAL